jgi:myo-inositol-1(or 4)-monophosphatase
LLDNIRLLDIASTIASGAAGIANTGLYTHVGRWNASSKDGNDADVMTAIDLAIDGYIRSKLRELRPGDGVVTEEDEELSGTSGIVWVCDPIDGSASFASGAGSSTVSIAATSDGVSLAGVVIDIGTGETFTASRGHGAHLNGRPIQVSGLTHLSEAVVASDFAHDRSLRGAQTNTPGQVASHVRAIRNVGSTVLHIAWVGAGRLDAMYQTTTKWWDVAAAGLIVEEAGGVLSDLSGGSMRPESIVASTPGIHDELVDLMLLKTALA